MAEAFIAQLPHVGRGILENEDQRCFICMENYGTTPSASCIIERAVKLPCNHIMGSECISIWVSAPAQGGGGNNTCPFCRHVLFQLQPPQSLPPRAEHIRLHRVLENRCVGLSAQLGLNHNPDISRMARWIANHIHDGILVERDGLDDDGPFHAIAAASVYVTSHILGDARSLEMISSCVDDVGDDVIRRAYVLLHGYRYDLINLGLLARFGLGLGGIDEILPSITA
ncbi:MAG: hypothetical protein Q9175_005621 [Cornicularia normoerica]